MNKNDILNKLNELNLDKNKYIIISGAALVVLDIIESTNDIDLSCKYDYYKKINWKTKIGYFNTEIKYYGCFELGTNFYTDNYNVVNGFKIQNTKEIYKLKLLENKDKDKNTIKKLKKYIK